MQRLDVFKARNVTVWGERKHRRNLSFAHLTVRFVHVVILEDIRRRQARQQCDKRKRHSDEREFSNTQVEEQHVFR